MVFCRFRESTGCSALIKGLAQRNRVSMVLLEEATLHQQCCLLRIPSPPMASLGSWVSWLMVHVGERTPPQIPDGRQTGYIDLQRDASFAFLPSWRRSASYTFVKSKTLKLHFFAKIFPDEEHYAKIQFQFFPPLCTPKIFWVIAVSHMLFGFGSGRCEKLFAESMLLPKNFLVTRFTSPPLIYQPPLHADFPWEGVGCR